jgi:hypothetical protein
MHHSAMPGFAQANRWPGVRNQWRMGMAHVVGDGSGLTAQDGIAFNGPYARAHPFTFVDSFGVGLFTS